MQKMTKIGIMGGTFDPIHYGHLIMAESAREAFRLDKILFVVSANPPHKPNEKIIDANIRHNMVAKAVKDNPFFEISDIEIKSKEKSYTFHTLTKLKELCAENLEIYLIIGMDEAVSFTSWLKYEDIFNLAHVVCANRLGYNGIIHPKISLFDMPTIEISSSGIRDYISAKKSIKYLVPPEIENYITKKGLYI